MSQIKVLIIDDSAFYRRSIAEILQTDSRYTVMGSLSNGAEAIRFLGKNKPDVITLDLEMPMMDGFTFLRWLMSNKPVPVVVISSRSEGQNIINALEFGAVDFVLKPSHRATLEIKTLKDEICSKVLTAASIDTNKLVHKRESPRAIDPDRLSPSDGSSHQESPSVVAIGASTGGPPAIQSLLLKLPADFPAAIVVSQHMPPGFTLYFAERLNRACQLKVKEAEGGDLLHAGHVYIAPGNHHLAFRKVRTRVAVELRAKADHDRYTPSIDQMMISVAEMYGSRTLAVLLTGMGSDGKIGMMAVKEKGGATIAESEETSVVFGMPKEAIKMGVIDYILPLNKIPGELQRWCAAQGSPAIASESES